MKDEFSDKMKICFVGNLATTFIKRDYEILKRHFDVDVIEPPYDKKRVVLPSLCCKKIKQTNLIFGWLAGGHYYSSSSLEEYHRCYTGVDAWTNNYFI